jgi:nuclease S1
MHERIMSANLRRMVRFFSSEPRSRLALATRPLLISALLSSLCWATAAQAWGPKGHRLVASLASAELTPQARAEVARLLRGEAEPTLAGVANWADTLRDNPTAGDADLGKRTARWHYVNLAEDDCSYVRLLQCANGDCLIEAIRTQRALLADRRQSNAVRAQALKFLVHFVGDAHQPLHAGYASDRGGNTVQVQLDGKGTNLHKLWDGEVIASANMSERRYLRHLLRMALPAEARSSSEPADWVEASCRIVLQDGFYPPRPKIEPGYFSRWRPTADAQLRIAGHRLAVLLNGAFADAMGASP